MRNIMLSFVFTNKQQEELRKELDDNYSMVHNY